MKNLPTQWESCGEKPRSIKEPLKTRKGKQVLIISRENEESRSYNESAIVLTRTTGRTSSMIKVL